MPKRVVFDISDEQLNQFIKLGEKEKELGTMGRKAFEEWLKRRQARANRALIQWQSISPK
jgi:hypothetical protein